VADLKQSHPQLVLRYRRLEELCRARGWRVGVTSSTRSRAVQEDLYRRWLAGTYKVPAVANPNGNGHLSPWGWRWRGSYHMPQGDGFSHALDLNRSGCTWAQLEELARSCGLRRTVSNEPWHYQWVNRATIFEAPALVTPGGGKRRHTMFIWTCDQNDGRQVAYLWTGRHVISLHSLDLIAWNATVGGHIPHLGHLPESSHNLLLSRLAGHPDPHTKAIGTWGHA